MIQNVKNDILPHELQCKFWQLFRFRTIAKAVDSFLTVLSFTPWRLRTVLDRAAKEDINLHFTYIMFFGIYYLSILPTWADVKKFRSIPGQNGLLLSSNLGVGVIVGEFIPHHEVFHLILDVVGLHELGAGELTAHGGPLGNNPVSNWLCQLTVGQFTGMVLFPEKSAKTENSRIIR